MIRNISFEERRLLGRRKVNLTANLGLHLGTKIRTSWKEKYYKVSNGNTSMLRVSYKGRKFCKSHKHNKRQRYSQALSHSPEIFPENVHDTSSQSTGTWSVWN